MAEQSGPDAVTDGVLLTVHGPVGAVDVVVPWTASPVDVAAVYAEEGGLDRLPRLVTTDGTSLGVAASLGAAGLRSGDVVVATHELPVTAEDPAGTRGSGTTERASPARVATPEVAATTVAGALAVATGYAAGTAPESSLLPVVAVAVLLGGALLALVPAGRGTAERGAVAPVFAAAAAYAVVGRDPAVSEEIALGAAGLVAAAAAATARASGAGLREVHGVWLAGGCLWFLLPAAQMVLGLPAQVTWALLVLLAALAVRLVPRLAVDVPDQMLLDLEQLAVSAWSARERTPRRRGRMMVPSSYVRALMARGSRIVHAAAAGIAVTMAFTAPALLAAATDTLDRRGALVLLFAAGSLVLLAARHFRYRVAQALLRVAGLTCWVWLAAVLVGAGAPVPWVVVGGCLALGPLLAVIGVARGRGWRSVWWSRRAEVAETLSGAAAVASLTVASGLFRAAWEMASGFGG